MSLQLVGSVEVLQRFGNTFAHCLLTFTNPDTRVIVLLVRLVFTLWVADLSLDVVVLVDDVVPDADQVGPLQVCVEIDLYDAVADGIGVFLLG